MPEVGLQPLAQAQPPIPTAGTPLSDTAQNISDRSEVLAPRKRQRLEVEGIPEPDMEENHNPAQGWVKHGRFYHPDADCVIRVERTLFRVHRFLLARDSSAFENMFSMPHGEPADRSPEGYSDSNPIVLEGESACDFAELLTVLYALPSELHDYRINSTNVSKLLTVAEMTNKYHFAATSAWAVGALCQVTECPESPWRASRSPHHLPPREWCTPPVLQRLIQVALLCGHEQLCSHAVEHWVQLIVVDGADPASALDTADRFDLPRLAGTAYYETLLRVDDALQYTRGDIAHALTGPQRARLLSGGFALVRRWERVRAAPPAFPRPEGCTFHAHGCVGTWATVWREAARCEAVAACRTVDVLGRVGVMADVLDADNDLRYALTPTCWRAAMESVQKLLVREEEALAGYFRDLVREGEGAGAVEG